MANKCPVNIKSPVSIQKWVCDHAHPIGCVEHGGLYYFNHVEGNVSDPAIGVGQGTYSGGFTLCSLITWLSNRAIDAYHDEEYDAMLSSFFSCLSTYAVGKYAAGDVVINGGIIFESLIDDNELDTSNTGAWTNYGTACTILTAIKVNSNGDAVLGVDCNGDEVIAGSSISTCSDLNAAISTINDRIDSEVSTLNTRIDGEVSTLNSTIVNEVTTLNTRIDNEVTTLNTTINTEVTNLQSQVTSNDNDIQANADCCAQNASDIDNNGTAIAINANNISNNATNIANNTSNINSNTSDITDNSVAIATNTSNISNIQSDVSDLQTDVVSNTACCVANSTNITTIQGDVNDLQTSVTNNSTAITSNATNISNNSVAITNAQNTADTKQGQLKDCSGTDHAAGAQVPSCAEMNQAISDAVPDDIVFGDGFLIDPSTGVVSLDCEAVAACVPTCDFTVWAAGNTATVVEGSNGSFYKGKAAGDLTNNPVGNTTDWLGPFDTCELATAAIDDTPECEFEVFVNDGTNTSRIVQVGSDFYGYLAQFDDGTDSSVALSVNPEFSPNYWVGPFNTCLEADAARGTPCNLADGADVGGYTTDTNGGTGPITTTRSVGYDLRDYTYTVLSGYWSSTGSSESFSECRVSEPTGTSSTHSFSLFANSTLIGNIQFEISADGTTMEATESIGNEAFVVTELKGVCTC